MSVPNEDDRPKLTTLAADNFDLPEPTIGEQFGRRRGQDWPSPPLRSAGRQQSSSKSVSRSKSRDLPRRTSGILYKVIPPKPNEILDSFEEVEAVLNEHRIAEEAAGHGPSNYGSLSTL
ncbi:hypothetical protein BGZ46_004014, partial [Entomortierella lignicola]